jgi:hypothetical protein
VLTITNQHLAEENVQLGLLGDVLVIANEHQAEMNVQLGLLGDVLVKTNVLLTQILAGEQPSPTGPGQAVSGKLTITPKGEPMSFTVDSTTGTGTYVFDDDKGDVATQPAGSTVAFSSDTPTVATVAADGTNPLQADITIVGVEGTATITAVTNGADGNPLAFAADGTTPFVQAAGVLITVSAGQATTGAFSVA